MRTVIARLSVIVVATFALLIVGVFAWQKHELAQTQNVTRYLSQKTQADFKKLLDLKAEKFRTFVHEDSIWDDLYRFPAKPDKKWAHDSLVSALTYCKADAYYIIGRDGKLICGESGGSFKLNDLLLPYPSWSKLFETQAGNHRIFFNSSVGLAEMQIATIHRTNDSERKGPYTGYLAIVKVWTPQYVDELGTWIAAKVEIAPQEKPEVNTVDGYRFSTPLMSSENRPAAFLNVYVLDSTIAESNRAATGLTKLFLVYSLVLFALVIGAIGILVCRPLGIISRALKDNDRSELEPVIRKDDEFGRIAVLIDDVLKHRSDLKQLSNDLEDFIKQQKLQLEDELYDDPLTLLRNRVYYNEHLEKLLLDPTQYSSLAVILIDIDDFQVINNTIDMSSGDALLCEVANRLRILVPEEAALVRFGGDEFSIILPMQSDGNELRVLLESIEGSFKHAFTLIEQSAHCTISMGVAHYTSVEIGTIGSDITKHADIALHHSKTAGKNRTTFYELGMQENTENRALAETSLRQAIERDEFEVYYHPIVGIETGELHAVEALVRWSHPTRGIVSPSEFIPTAEQTGQIIPIGYIVLRKACEEIGHLWKTLPNCPKFVLSVNLSGKQLDEPEVITHVKAILKETDFPTQYLQLEVTETAMAQNMAESISRLETLRDLGMTIAIDDFGTGYSSISSLGDLPANIVKVDMCFVRRLPNDIEAISILRAVTAMAASVGLETVAEGVESGEQLEMLAILGYHYGQGYLFSLPLPIHDLAELIVDKPNELRERVMTAYTYNVPKAA